VKTTAAASLAIGFGSPLGAFAAGSDTIKVGLIGCGGRGTGAALDCMKAAPGVEVVAMGDLLPDRLASSLERLTKDFPDRVKVPADRRFTGFDNSRACAPARTST
jgi:predicted homoserine dehydrogenase-like protein